VVPEGGESEALLKARTHQRKAIQALNYKESTGQDWFAYARFFPEFLLEHGGTWPPYPTFEGWPACWQAVLKLCDEMPSKLAEKTPDATQWAKNSRKWMTDRWDAINDDDLMAEVEKLAIASEKTKDWNSGKDRLFGMLACVTQMTTGYRWATTPVPFDAPQRKESSIDFPKGLWRMFVRLNKVFGTPLAPCAVSTFLANAIYKGEGNERVGTGMRFKWNAPEAWSYKRLVQPTSGSYKDDEWVHVKTQTVYRMLPDGTMEKLAESREAVSEADAEALKSDVLMVQDHGKAAEAEHNLGLIFINVEVSLLPLLKALALYTAVDASTRELSKVHRVSNTPEIDQSLFAAPVDDHRLKMLKVVSQCMRAVFEAFRFGLVPANIDAEAFSNNVQIMHGWNLTEAKAAGKVMKQWDAPFGGSTAPQLLVMQVIDSFLNLGGTSVVHRGNIQSREECFTDSMRTLLAMLENSCTCRMADRSDVGLEVKQLFLRMMGMVNGFRMLHKKKVAEFLVAGCSKQTAGYHIDALGGAKKSLDETFKEQMQMRIEEIAKIKSEFGEALEEDMFEDECNLNLAASRMVQSISTGKVLKAGKKAAPKGGGATAGGSGNMMTYVLIAIVVVIVAAMAAGVKLK